MTALTTADATPKKTSIGTGTAGTAVSVQKDVTADELKEIRGKKREELSQKEKEMLEKQLSVKERLERKLRTDEVRLELEDDIGKFSLRFRKLTPQEHDRLASINLRLKHPGNTPDQTRALVSEMYDILGSASLDGLDAEYWRAGTGYSPDILLLSVLKVMAASSYPAKEQVEEIVSFRAV